MRRISVPKDKRIGVMVSGGWDSAVLWYLVKSACLDSGQECTPFVVPKLDGALHYSKLVVETINKLLGAPVQEPIVVGKELANNPWDYVTNGAYEVFGEEYIDHLFIGMTAYSQEVHNRHENEDPHPRFEPTEEQRQYVTWPFEDMTKDETVKLGFDLGIADVIMPITHSCTEQNKGRCGVCYWCTERKWAFEKNSYRDIGEE